VARSLVLDENSLRLERWLEALGPVRLALIEPLAAIFRNPARSDDERFQAAVALEQFARDDAPLLVRLVKDAVLRQYTVLQPLLKSHRAHVIPLLESELAMKPPHEGAEAAKNELAAQQANSAVALLALGKPGAVWPLLRHSAEPRARGYLLDRIESRGVDPGLLVERLHEEKDVSARRALIVALADYHGKEISASESQALERELLE
jgi:hypothetical protein